MIKKYLKLFLFSLFILFSTSCTLLTKNTGDIWLKLPSVSQRDISSGAGFGRSARNQSDKKEKFIINLLRMDGSLIREYEFEESASVYIPDIPVGKYRITLNCNAANGIYFGEQTVSVKPGNSVSVEIRLKVKEVGSISGNITFNPSNIMSVPELTVEAQNVADSSKKYSGTVTSVQDEPAGDTVTYHDEYSITGLPYGTYKVVISGKTKYATYKGTLENIKINSNTLVTRDIEVVETKESMGNIELSFTNGTSIPELRFDLYQKGELCDDYSNWRVTPSVTNSFKDILVGTYTIIVSGQDSDNNYSFEQEVIVEDGKTTQITDGTITITPKNGKPSVDLVKPNPSKGIYCVGGDGATDENNDGNKSFKTLAAALNFASQKGGTPTFNIIGTVKETESKNVQQSCIIQGVEGTNPKIEATVSGDYWLFLNGTDIKINNLAISVNGSGVGLKIGSGAVTLDKNVTVVNNGAGKKAISVGNSTTLTLSTPHNVDSTNVVVLLNGGKIKAATGFSSIPGNIILDMTGVGGTDNGQYIFAEVVSELPAVTKKFGVKDNKYIVQSDGKITKPATIGNMGQLVEAVRSTAENGELYIKLDKNKFFVGGSETININKNIKIIAVGDLRIVRSSNFYEALFNVASGKTLTLSGVTLDGGSTNSNSALIVSQGNVILNNSILQNNNNIITNGGGILVKSGDVTLTGTSKIENNTVAPAKTGKSIYFENTNSKLNGSTVTKHAYDKTVTSATK